MPDDIDLQPHEWDSDRAKPAEPFFGEGLPGAVAYVVGLAISISAVYFVLHH